MASAETDHKNGCAGRRGTNQATRFHLQKPIWDVYSGHSLYSLNSHCKLGRRIFVTI
jgi:hypothetical protein